MAKVEEDVRKWFSTYWEISSISYKHEFHTNARYLHGWFPADVVEQTRMINAPKPAASSTQLNINDNELQFAAVRDGYSSHGFSLRQWTPLPNTLTKSVAQPWTLPPTGANLASSGFASILRFRSQDPLKIHSRSRAPWAGPARGPGPGRALGALCPRSAVDWLLTGR
jgi:hypothetical protein